MSAEPSPSPWWPFDEQGREAGVLRGPWSHEPREAPGRGAHAGGHAADTGSDDGDGTDELAQDTLVLTDEELVALQARTPTVPLPYADLVPPEVLDTMSATALRGLFARGLVRVRGRDLEVIGTLSALLTVRAAAPVIAVMRRDVGVAVAPAPGGGPDDDPGRPAMSEAGAAQPVTEPRMPGDTEESLIGLRHLHVAGEHVVVEDVTESGLHVFGVAEVSDLDLVVAEFLDLDGAPPGTGDPVVLGVTEEEATAGLAALGGPTSLVDTVIRDATSAPGEGHLVTAALGPGGTFVAEATLQAHLQDLRDKAPVVFWPSAVEAAAASVAGLIRDAVRRVADADGGDASASATMGA